MEREIQAADIAREQAIREAEILHRIDHPNVVNVASVRLDNSPPFIEMDYVDGISLEAYLGKHGAPELPLAIEWARALTNAVAYLHRRGIYHRDIMPDNILIRTSDGNPVIVDFGLAWSTEYARLTRTGRIVGTPQYLAPEMLGRHEPTAALDHDSSMTVIDLLQRLGAERGTTTVMVTHDPRILDRADRIVTLEHGRIIGDTGPR